MSDVKQHEGSWWGRHKDTTVGVGAVASLMLAGLAGLAGAGQEEDTAAAPLAVATSTPTPQATSTPPPTRPSAAIPVPAARPAASPRPTPTSVAPPTPAPLAGRDGDGYAGTTDDFPTDPTRHSQADRDGDGVPNIQDAGPDNPARSAWDTGTVTDVIDGDTIDVQGHGRIRIIGIDTPERGECGFDEASRAMAELVLGQTVTLVPGARDDRDRYDRLLRYVDVGTRDAGLTLIERGLAIALYDSRDGYGQHTREDQYIAADQASANRTQQFCPVPAPAPAPAPPASGNCDPAYPGVCIPPAPPDLDCPQVPFCQFQVLPPDPHGFDRDGDGVGCESC